ncbi:MAG: hypothetical protein JO331_12070 [Verrucomicrobia bacterium]|nr:hypothetical protein [Verrucomicrobiota bacterium]
MSLESVAQPSGRRNQPMATTFNVQVTDQNQLASDLDETLMTNNETESQWVNL